VWVEGMVEGQITSSLVAAGPWGVMTPHQPPCTGSCVREGRCLMALQVLALGMSNALSKSFQAQDFVRVTLGRTLLLRKAFLQQICHIVAMRCGRQMLEEP
jgi:hypothetical protein